MYKSINKTFLLCIFLSFGLFANAQNSKFESSVFLGVSAPILDSGIGYHVGINPTYTLTSYLSAEASFSFIYTQINGAFLSGDKGHSNSVNAVVGGRLYFNSDEKKNRIYINFLLGGFYSNEDFEDNMNDEDFYDVGLSTGAYLELNRFLIGVSLDTPQNLTLKAGFIF